VFAPVTIGGRRYVDGGVHSVSNLDLVAGSDLDLVICLNPTSSATWTLAAGPTDWLANGVRAASAWRVRQEAAQVRRSGTEVLLLEPTEEDLEQMGVDLMSPIGRGYTALLARRTTAEQLQGLGRDYAGVATAP
jgi:NTE family protein